MSLADNLARVHPRSLGYRSHRLAALVRGRLWLQVLIGMALGIGTGILLGPSVGWLRPETSAVVGVWLALPGQLFLASLQMIVIPLAGIALILGVDRLLDMCRTAINVAGDLVACIALNAWVAGPTSSKDQMAIRREREAARARTGQDVLVDEG